MTKYTVRFKIATPFPEDPIEISMYSSLWFWEMMAWLKVQVAEGWIYDLQTFVDENDGELHIES